MKDVDLDNLFIVEYSVNQDNTHVRSLLEVLKNNRRNVSVGTSTDYVAVGVANTRKKADRLAHQIRVKLERARKGKRFKSNWHSVAQILKQINPLSLMQITDEPSQK